ncbi:MAG: hypothetical protein AAFU49_20435 [Pseudomonadota bacterium]
MLRALASMSGMLFGLMLGHAAAEGVPGADNLALRAGAEAWLTDKDPRAAVWVIGTLGAEGNQAARMLARRIEFHLGRDFPGMSRAERQALFPPDRVGSNKGFIRSPVSDDGTPTPSSLANALRKATTPEEWVERAEAMVAAGFRRRFVVELKTAKKNRTLDIEAILFAETVLTDREPAYANLWFLRAMEAGTQRMRNLLEPEEAEARRARWRGDPWPPAKQAEFAAALREERWYAIRAAGLLGQMDLAPPSLDAETADLYERWIELEQWFASRAEPGRPLSQPELERLGAVLLRDAERTPDLRPIGALCREHCPGSDALCAAASARSLRGLGDVTFLDLLGAILGPEAYFDSWRAARDALGRIGPLARRGELGPDWLPVPQCLRSAALREADRVLPLK